MKVKTKCRICRWTAGVSMTLVLGTVGNIEWGITPLGKGSLLLLLFFSIAALSAHKAGLLK